MSASSERLLITGANGFVGRAVVARALESGFAVTAAVRRGETVRPHPHLREVVVEDLEAETVAGWVRALEDVDAVIHTAGRAHVMVEHAADPLAEFRRINTLGTKRLARAAANRNVRRFVYVSSVKVNGEESGAHPFREADRPAPADPYAISKWEAEQELGDIAAATGLQTVVVRPPLVYGPGVRANFLSLLRWVDRGVPLPFATIANRRSLIGVNNLADLLLRCSTHEAAAGQLFLAAEGVPLSIAELVRAMATALGREARLWPAPRLALLSLGELVGRSSQVKRLCESLEIDGRKSRECLDWIPPDTIDGALRATVRWYRDAGQAQR